MTCDASSLVGCGKQKTAYERRISDWSSDVCSSDLAEDHAAARLRAELAGRLERLLGEQEGPEWTWFENGLSYDNARLPQALIVTGAAALSATLVEAGLRSLRWLVAMQTAPEGHFRPVGAHGFLMNSRHKDRKSTRMY